MRAKRISVVEYKRIKLLMRTKALIAQMFPQEPGLGLNVDYAVDHNLSAAALLRLRGVKVKGKR